MRSFSSALTRALDWVPPDKRRDWAARIFVASLAGWALSHAGLLLFPPWFFQHVLLAISWAAISLTAADVVATTDVRAKADEETTE